MVLADYADLDIYNNGSGLTGNDFIPAWKTELWVQKLASGANVPTIYTLTLGADVAVDDTEITDISADVEFDIYRGDVLKFSGAGTLVVVDEDKTVTTSSTTLKILPALAVLDGTTTPETARSYGMLPLRSLQEGGGFVGSGTAAESRNKSQGLWPARTIVEKDGSINVSGRFFRKDRAAALLNETWRSGSANFFVQIRYFPFIEVFDSAGTATTEGAGAGAIEGQFTLPRFDIDTSARSEYVGVEGEFQLAQQPSDYSPLLAA